MMSDAKKRIMVMFFIFNYKILFSLAMASFKPGLYLRYEVLRHETYFFFLHRFVHKYYLDKSK